MKIEIKKVSHNVCEYTITREDTSVELISLETKTYLVHDVCHYAVEKNLNYAKGFWGMLAKGYTFRELFGKDNLLTKELRLIEKIVGPVQSTYLGYIPKQDFNLFVDHIDFKLQENVLTNCLNEMDTILKNWEQLHLGQQLTLEWNSIEKF